MRAYRIINIEINIYGNDIKSKVYERKLMGKIMSTVCNIIVRVNLIIETYVSTYD